VDDTKGMGLYKFVSYEIQKEGYGIQIGAFEDYRNVLEVTNKLMQNNVQDIMIHTRIVDGKDQFRMLIGPFNSRGAAESYQNTLASMNMKGWILNLSEL
jgi:cell division septation protein DedD